MNVNVANADAAFEIVWDEIGVAHVFATTIADAYRGMGYAAGYERLWQIHLSTAYANGEAAALLGERFVGQDALQRACNVHGGATALPPSDGDWIVDAYLDGLNSFVDGLDEPPPEFVHAGAVPRHYIRADVAARYRFTCWFQHKTWGEKMMLGRLMATHGVDCFKNHVLHFTDDDAALVAALGDALERLPLAAINLGYADANVSGSNNWAVTGALSASGKPLLAMDPHQPHAIPNTFFYVHLHVGDWDAFGAAFPGVPYFMMGYTRDIAWGLTTGFVDANDVYVEKLRDGEYLGSDGWQPLKSRSERIEVKGGEPVEIEIASTPHGPLLESLLSELGHSTRMDEFGTALHWSFAKVPTSAGALAQLPLARDAADFGDKLFEADVCPLVNNIICVDKNDGMRRFVATTMSVRKGVSGSVPLAGWEDRYDFELSTQEDLTVEIDPARGYAWTANQDTMGERGSFYIHNFPASSDRADRIEQHLSAGGPFTTEDFKRMQLDLEDPRAARLLPDLLEALRTSEDEAVALAIEVLSSWDQVADVDSSGACLFYPFLDRYWQRRFMVDVLDEPLLEAWPAAAPTLSRFDIEHFLAPDSPWVAHREKMQAVIAATMRRVVEDVRSALGADPQRWRWGDLQKIAFRHTLAKHEPWRDLQVGPAELGGSGTTLGMALHMGPGPGRANPNEVPCRVYHGPSYRLVVDLADPDRASFVIAGGNGGRPDSPFTTNLFPLWLRGEYAVLHLRREELAAVRAWTCEPA